MREADEVDEAVKKGIKIGLIIFAISACFIFLISYGSIDFRDNVVMFLASLGLPLAVSSAVAVGYSFTAKKTWPFSLVPVLSLILGLLFGFLAPLPVQMGGCETGLGIFFLAIFFDIPIGSIVAIVLYIKYRKAVKAGI
jgi:O-antigen/teichoic acid export membrane protein